MSEGTNTVFFVPRTAIPYSRTVTYSQLVASIRSHKTETHSVRVTIGGNRLEFPGNTTTKCASLTTTKCLLNSIISTPRARFLTLDFKTFYYNTPMARYEYMKISLDILTEEIIAQYNLCQLASNRWVYLYIRKGMLGLKQAIRIVNDRLQIHLSKFVYSPVAQTPSLWKHDTKDTFFSLVGNDLGVKYVGKETTDHLIQALQKLYTISNNWTGSLYFCLALD